MENILVIYCEVGGHEFSREPFWDRELFDKVFKSGVSLNLMDITSPTGLTKWTVTDIHFEDEHKVYVYFEKEQHDIP